ATGVDINGNHKVVVDWRSSDGRLRVFLDGVEVYNEINKAKGTVIQGDGFLALGHEQDVRDSRYDFGQATTGKFYDMLVAPRILSEAERKAYFEGNDEGIDLNNLTFFWKMGEASGTVIHDISSNNNHGTYGRLKDVNTHENPTNTNIENLWKDNVQSATANFSQFAGTSVAMNDSGSNGDSRAYDETWTSEYTLQSGHPLGSKFVSITAQDSINSVTKSDDTFIILNDNPTALAINNNSIEEASPLGTEIATLTTTDTDSTDTHIYEFISGIGDEDNAKFSINANKLKLNFVPEYANPQDSGDTASNNTYAIRVKTTDRNGQSYEERFIVTVTQNSSSIGLAEVVEDIAGNEDGTPSTAIQINSIDGVSGAIDGVDYSDAFVAAKDLTPSGYEDPANPTAAEIQTIITAENARLDAVLAHNEALAEVVEDIAGNKDGI
ncbi:MAG: hypothetical protein KAG56_04335, partial [Sulfurovaceae bacterium]|nr:hypothetical protein [Sulfurovaceae bacterium]